MQCGGSALVSMGIRIQNFGQCVSGSGSRDLMTKNGKKLQLKKIKIFLIKNAVSLSIGEVFGPQKRTSSTSKHEIFYFCGSFLQSWIRFRIQPSEINADPDPATLVL
jgi:hypothetical protein